MRVICIALVASSMLVAPAAFAQEVVVDPGVGPLFDTYYEGNKVRTYEGDIVVGAEVPADYELAPLPDVVITKYPKLKTYRYVRIGKRTAIVYPSGRKVVKFVD